MKRLFFLILLIPILCYSAPTMITNTALANKQKIQQIKKNNNADTLLIQDTSKMDLIALRVYVGKLSLLVKDLVNMMGE